MKTIYYCGKCNAQFNDKDECLRHEQLCGEEVERIVCWTLDAQLPSLKHGPVCKVRKDDLARQEINHVFWDGEDRDGDVVAPGRYRVRTLLNDPAPGIQGLIKLVRSHAEDEMDEALRNAEQWKRRVSILVRMEETKSWERDIEALKNI